MKIEDESVQKNLTSNKIIEIKKKLRAKVKKSKTKSRFKYIMRGNPYQRIVDLANSGKVFSHSHTQRTTSLKVGNRAWYYGGADYSFSEFHLQKKLKKDIKKNIEEKGLVVPKYNQEDVKYNVYSDNLMKMEVGVPSNDIMELDINKAYYQCAYNLGYMSKSMYQTCLGLKKHVRLRFIGTIATRKRHYIRRGWEILDHRLDEDPELRFVWFHICRQVDDCLSEFKNMVGDKFYMYYVDGIYLKKGDYTKELEYISNRYGFEFKENKVRSIRRIVDSKDGFCQIVVNKFDDKDGEFRDKQYTPKTNQQYRSDKWKTIVFGKDKDKWPKKNVAKSNAITISSQTIIPEPKGNAIVKALSENNDFLNEKPAAIKKSNKKST